jgi:hypothetical protein
MNVWCICDGCLQCQRRFSGPWTLGVWLGQVDLMTFFMYMYISWQVLGFEHTDNKV